MASKNAIRVNRFRKIKGHDILRNKYHRLRFKYNISVIQSNIMKFWSVDKIRIYIEENNLKPTKEYINSLKGIDKI